MDVDYRDALATVRGDLLMAVAETSLETKLTASPAVEKLLDAMMANLTSPSICWALREIANHNSPTVG
jgi:hypothetical protein